MTKSLAIILICAGCGAPQGEKIKGREAKAVIVNPPAWTVTMAWSYPVAMETPDLVFNLYHAFSLTEAPTRWPLLRVIPGTERSATVNADHPQEFFALTASNQFGESDFAGGAR